VRILKVASVLEKAYELTKDDEKAQILRGLSALLQTTTLKTKRAYITKAMDYIEKH
jgi:hypothetical protein